MTKLTKKAGVNIMKHVLKVDKDASKLTTYDQAWEILSTAWNIEGEIKHTIKEGTCFFVYKNDEMIGKILIPNGFDDSKGDFDWTKIYKAADEFIIKNKLWKKTKKNQQLIVVEEEEEEEELEVVINKVQPEFVDWKKERDKVYHKIYHAKKTGKDTTELEKEFEEIKKHLKK